MSAEATVPSRTASRTLALVCLAGSLMTLDISILTIGLEEIAADFGARLADLQWVMATYPLVFAALLLPAGSLSDLIGRRRVFVWGVVVFTASSLACALAGNPLALAVARGVQGAGGAMTLAASVPLVAAAYPPQRRAAAMGVFSGASAAAAALGPLVGGVLVDTWGWEAIFLVNLVPGVVLVAGTLAWIAGGGGAAGRFDVLGAVTVTVGLLGLNYAVVTGADHGWSRPDVLAGFVVAAAALAWFVRAQTRTEHPLLDLALFRSPAFTGAAVLSFLTRVLNFGVLAYLVLWLQGMLGFSALEAGLRLLPLTAASMATSLLAGRLIGKVGLKAVVVTGFAVFAAGFGFLMTVDENTPWTALLAGFVLLGAAAGLLYPPLITISVGVAPPERAGMAAGLVNSFFPLGTALGVSGFGAVLSAGVAGAMADSPDEVRAAVSAGRFADVPADAVDAGRIAFTDGLAVVGVVAAALAIAAAVLAAATVPKALSQKG